MITIILEYLDLEIDRYKFKNGDKILITDDTLRFPLLSELSLYSYDVFSSHRMEQLVLELIELRDDMVDNSIKKEIEAIISLAKKCSENKNSTLTFTPFYK